MRLTLSCLALTSLLLSGCGRLTTPANLAPVTILTVPVTAAQSDEDLTRQYGGRVELRTETFAVIGDPTHAPLQAQGTGPAPQENQDVVAVNPGQTEPGMWGNIVRDFWPNAPELWSSIVRDDWRFNSSDAWVSDTYSPLPVNTAAWKKIGLKEAHQGTALGAGKIIAVIDTGLDLTHPMFTNLLTPANTWRDFVDDDATPQDLGTVGKGSFGHGTVVAGIAAQLAPRAKIMPLRVLDSDGRGDTLNVAAAVVWATNHGAHVINLSLGTSRAQDALTQAIAYANSKRVLVVAAAGNFNKAAPDYPAAQMKGGRYSVAVGSVNQDDLKSDFSSYGEAIGLMAPGQEIAAPFPDRRMGQFSGTSMSAPVVAGALALGLGEGAGAEQTLKALKDEARRIDRLDGNAAYQGLLGKGRLDLKDFIDELDD
ncbi:S8 family serine peptidase [Deinococcus sp. HMF7604]|uniref:S8 family serine peptidase n=1 Tax=Deinococcus betulae TaxID=2873312 RepID=UPI001CCE2733|nr:S8 family serine peptidase [Deinococcus betulae]MBZ9751558.1 S8 family serine peptidase [Deinococcus betulae]